MGQLCGRPASPPGQHEFVAPQGNSPELTNRAFVFIKPHAVTPEMKDLVKKKMSEAGIKLTSEGAISAEEIDKKMLIDTHYGAIAAKAMKLKPEELAVQPQAKALFEKTFQSAWEKAVAGNLVYNAKDACTKLGIDGSQLEQKWRLLKKDVDLLKFGGGFYVGKVEGIFVVNAFFLDMRSSFVKPGSSIYFYTAEWDAGMLSWADFRGKVLGATDPSAASEGSIRNTVFKDWQQLKLTKQPDTGLNGVHASASPFEGYCERCNWLASTADPFEASMVSKGLSKSTIRALMDDPQVDLEGKSGSTFDQLEDVNAEECLNRLAKMKLVGIPLAEQKNFAFVFIKPHAVNAAVKDLVKKKLGAAGITLVQEGTISAEDIDKKGLIDNHYGAIAAKAMKHKPESLTVQPQAKELFKSKFGLEFDAAVSQKLVFNAKDACEKLGTDLAGMGEKWGKLVKGETLLKFGGGFYVGKIDAIYVVNGFYMDMRSTFCKPGASIHYYAAEWEADGLSWADFRGKVLGATDPAAAVEGSVRNTVLKEWQKLGLTEEPNTGLNGVHASASPFEGFCERCNWMGASPSTDPFGAALLAKGMPEETIRAFMLDPQVNIDGKNASCFDELEDINGKECLEKATKMTLAK